LAAQQIGEGARDLDGLVAEPESDAGAVVDHVVGA
jgi:hypothetical protein